MKHKFYNPNEGLNFEITTTEQAFKEGQILCLDKPYGRSSFWVVNQIKWKLKKHFGIKKIKIGHAGTLDPLATGLVIVCTGKATKTIPSIQEMPKTYLATLKLGATTPSFDLETNEDATFPTSHISLDNIMKTLEHMLGTHTQTPPVFSAVKVDGKRAYELAREGKSPEVKSKQVTFYGFEVLNFENNELCLLVRCSKGTYIRALARDLGKALDSGAYLIDLRRTEIGGYRV